MADAQIIYRELNFLIGDKETVVTVVYTSDEPDSPYWGGGSKSKSFPPHRSIVDIIQTEIAGLAFLLW